MHSHLISNAGSQEAAHYQAIDLSGRRERAMEAMQMIVLNDLQQGDPQTCSAFAEFCTESLSVEVTLALCLSRIHQDNVLGNQALAELNAHVDGSREQFCKQEIERRIAAQEWQAEAQAMATLEFDHV